MYNIMTNVMGDSVDNISVHFSSALSCVDNDDSSKSTMV